MKRENFKTFLIITDNAGGIKKELLPKKLFEYNVSTKKDSLGLGLYLSKIIVNDRLNAQIEAFNKHNSAVFKITFN